MSTPPPYGTQPTPGQHPGQTPNPYGAPAAGGPNPYATPGQAPGTPYGQPPQQPYPGQAPIPGQPYPGAQYPLPVEAPKKSWAARMGTGLAIRIGVLAVVGIGAVIYAFASGDPSTASVGDCVHNSGTDSKPDVSTLSCTDPKADFKVLKTFDSSDTDLCKDVPGIEAEYYQTGRSSILLCLGKNDGH